MCIDRRGVDLIVHEHEHVGVDLVVDLVVDIDGDSDVNLGEPRSRRRHVNALRPSSRRRRRQCLSVSHIFGVWA